MIRQLSVPRFSLALPSLVWLPVALLWVGYIAFAYLVFSRGGPGLYDFETYYMRANDLLHGGSLYDGVNGAHIYLYPPLLGQAFMPLVAWTSFGVVAGIWFGLNILALVSTMLMLTPYLPANRLWLYWLLPILFIPNFKGLYVGQVTPLLLALITGVWVARKNNWPGLAGALLALSAWIKVYPALLVIYFIWKRDWRLVRSVIITGVALGLLQIVISGPGLMLEFFSILTAFASGGQPAGNFKNSSVLGFAARLFGEAPPVQTLVYDPTLYTVTRLALTALVGGLAVYAIVAVPKHDHSERRFDLEYALVLLVSMLLSSTLWVGAMPPLLLAYVLIIRQPTGFKTRWLWLLSFFLVTVYHPLLLGSVGSVMPNLLYSLGFFGIMLLWGLLVALLIGRSGGADSERVVAL